MVATRKKLNLLGDIMKSFCLNRGFLQGQNDSGRYFYSDAGQRTTPRIIRSLRDNVNFTLPFFVYRIRHQVGT